VPLSRLHPHPANPNLMSEERRGALARHIERQGRYPPLVVRPHPELEGHYQILDGHQRGEVLRQLGLEEALCFLWPCDDEQALLLLATLNRLEGEDVPGRRADLIGELAALLPPEELALLLPEDPTEIEQALHFIDLDPDALLAELTAAAEREAATGPRLISFAVYRDDEPVIEEAVRRAAADLDGRNRRGRALATICRVYLEVVDA
jgi:ParB-like chromosome segregation protein Spo0J